MDLFRDGVSNFTEDRATSYSHRSGDRSTSTIPRSSSGRWESLKGSCPICNGAHKSCKINGDLILMPRRRAARRLPQFRRIKSGWLLQVPAIRQHRRIYGRETRRVPSRAGKIRS